MATNTVKTIFQADTKSQDRAIGKLETDLARYQRQRQSDEEKLTRHIERQAEARSRAEIKALQNTLREVQRIRREEERLEGQRSQRNAGYRQTAAGVAIGGAVAGGYLAQQAIDKAIEQSRANRLLASAATEAGVAQEKLSQANKNFAESVGLSNVAAATTTAQIQRLATNAGRPGDVDKYLKAFADLGAARGIGGKDLETLIGTILSGQDEGLNRLGIADPGQLQKEYAKSIGKTTEELTQQEKVLAGVNAVLEKSAIFAGAAESRMNSLEGQVAKTAAAWENFTNALSQNFATSGPVTDFINEASRLLQGLQVDLEAVNRELAKGKSPEQIAKDLYSGPSAGDYLSSGASLLLRSSGIPGRLLSNYLGGAGAEDATNPQKVYERRLAEFTDQIRNQQTGNKQQEVAAAQQRAAASVKFYTDIQKKQLEDLAAAEKKAVEAAKKAAEDRKRIVDEAIRKAKEYAEAVKNAQRDVLNAQRQVIDDYASSIQGRVSAVGLRDQARQFRAGRLDTDAERAESLQSRVQSQLNAVGGIDKYYSPFLDPKTGLPIRKAPDALDAQRVSERNKAIIDITNGLDPSQLSYEQNQLAARAREAYARELEKNRTEGLEALKANTAALQALLKQGGHQVRIVDESNGRATVTKRPTPAATNARY